MSEDTLYILHTDGAAKGNPGPAGIGIALFSGTNSAEPIIACSDYIGEATNNVAEYRGLIFGLRKALEMGVARIEARTDSELMARQLSGQYKVSSALILPYYQEAKQLLSRFDEAKVIHVLRGKNALADKLANQGVASGRKPPEK